MKDGRRFQFKLKDVSKLGPPTISYYNSSIIVACKKYLLVQQCSFCKKKMEFKSLQPDNRWMGITFWKWTIYWNIKPRTSPFPSFYKVVENRKNIISVMNNLSLDLSVGFIYKNEMAMLEVQTFSKVTTLTKSKSYVVDW